ncbi:MAG: 50S ribosomal protein P1 [Candidatus Micrarchaeota archaeon]|nr:50S ribosomal protein P1 [Candidatus Micrarchaeota archaeon]MDE1834565.1 50S ribosomal protein P1 [Candidatus Micrarchaeota archaeon]MDE1859877.1 50S ribosomal protein P1 [Candidatus Micrarchaeota archaeon]
MEYIYAALLLDAAGKEISEKSLAEVVKAAGLQVDEAMAKSVATSLKEVNIKEVIKNAQSVQMAAPAAATGGKPEAKKEAPAEEKVSEEQAAGGLASLFG